MNNGQKQQPVSNTFWLPLISAIILVVLTAGLTAYFNSRNDRVQKRWEMKREAGRHALEIIDQYFANEAALGRISNMPKVSYQFEKMDDVKVREVCNELVLSCDNTNAITTFLEILSSGKSTGTSGINVAYIQKLRNDIRTELGFGPLDIPLDTVWVADLFPNVQTNSLPARP
jgi:hypothetical protein